MSFTNTSGLVVTLCAAMKQEGGCMPCVTSHNRKLYRVCPSTVSFVTSRWPIVWLRVSAGAL